MGTLGALGMAGAVSDGQITLEQALRWHLAANHFPPVSQDYVPVAVLAIQKANEEEWDLVLDMGVMVAGASPRTVGEIVDGLHLHAFVTYEEEEARADHPWQGVVTDELGMARCTAAGCDKSWFQHAQDYEEEVGR